VKQSAVKLGQVTALSAQSEVSGFAQRTIILLRAFGGMQIRLTH
jgi:hypothetical protein